jgi:hypothetical protein
MTAGQKDNSTFAEKVAIRRLALRQVEQPVILETHGGYGHLWRECYRDAPPGTVFEKNADRAAILAQQRPAWAVYEGDCVKALWAGVGGHQPVTLLDLDPYGEPWPALEAFFASPRPFAPFMAVVVNDGLRQSLKMQYAWPVKSLAGIVQAFGNNIFAHYLEACQLLLTELAAKAGYDLRRFTGRYVGHGGNMTHYLALLQGSDN